MIKNVGKRLCAILCSRGGCRGGRRGAAMIYVLCIMALITVLCMTTLLSANVVFSSARSEYDAERARILCSSLSYRLGADLTSPRFDFNSAEEEAVVRQTDGGSFWFYIRDGIWSAEWIYYNPDERGHTARYAARTFAVDPASLPDAVDDAMGDDIGAITVSVLWGSERDNQDKNDTPLTVTVTSTVGGQTCSVSRTYLLLCDNVGNYERWVWPTESAE